MSKEEKPIYWLVAAIGLVATLLFADRLAAQNEDWKANRLERCRSFAMFAVNLLYSHRELGLPWDRVNVDPDSEPLKELVIDFGDQGTPKELYDKVLGDCMGSST